MKKLPTYKLVISEEENDEREVDFIALVDEPAIQRNWLAFNEDKQRFQADKDRRIISGAAMVPGMKIFRYNEKLGEHYVVFDKNTVETICQKFFKKGYTSNFNLMHSAEHKTDGVYLFESFIIDKERGIAAPKGFGALTEGTWFISCKVDNDMIWDHFVKTGIFKGFSVEGVFAYGSEENFSDQSVMGQILQIIES